MLAKMSLGVLGLCLIALAAPLRAEDSRLTVKLASGREFTAHVDRRTDDLLWLRFSSGNARVLRPIAWDRVVAAELEGQDVPLAELRTVCARIKSSFKPVAESSPAESRSQAAEAVPAVASIRIDAWVANWNADVEADGIYLQLQPVDDSGRLIPVTGTAEVELFAQRQRKFHEAPQSGGWMTELIEHWSQRVEPEQIGTQGILLKLPFGAVHPDFSSGVDTFGLVHVRLVVPGSGVFEQSLDGVRLRNWSPVRSSTFLPNGPKFFSTEMTGRK